MRRLFCAWVCVVLPGMAWAAEELSAVVVTASRMERAPQDASVRTEVVDAEELERQHAQTLLDALENVPGVRLQEIHGKSGAGVSLQGLSGEQVLVLVDGLPLAPSTGSTVDLAQYLLADVERVEVVKGASSALYGSAAMGGVINVITKRTQPGLRASAKAQAGSRGGQNVSGRAWDAATRDGSVSLSGGSREWRFRASGEVLHDDGFTVDPQGWARAGDGVRRKQAAVRGDWLPAAGRNVWVEHEWYREDDRQRFNLYVPPGNVPQSKTEAIARDRTVLGAVWTGDRGLRAQLKGLREVYDSASHGWSRDVLQRRRHSGQETLQLDGQLDLPRSRYQQWQVGFDWRGEKLSQDNNGVSELAGERVRRESQEVFAQDEIMLGRRGSVALGLRARHDTDFGTYVAPRVALLWHTDGFAGGAGQLRASYGKGYRVPNLKELHYVFDHSSLGYMVLGNPDLQPESSNSFQVGAEIDWRRLSLAVNLFDNHLRDLIQIDESKASTVNGISVYRYDNVSRARTYGLEMSARWFVSPALTLAGGVTWMAAENSDTGEKLTRRPAQIARFGLDWMMDGQSTLALRGRAQSSETINAAGTRRSPGWAVWDVRFTRRLSPGWSFFAGVDNVLDRQRDFGNPDDYGPASGRRVFLGIQYEYERVS